MKVKASIKRMDINGNWITELEQVYIKTDPLSGDIINWGTDPSLLKKGFKEYTVNPAEEFKKYIEELKSTGAKKQAELLESIYKVPDPDVLANLKTIDDFANGWADTKFYQKIDAGFFEVVKETIKRIELAGYNVEITTLMPIEVLSIGEAIADMVDDDDFYEQIVKPILSSRTKIKDKIITWFNLADEKQIKNHHVKEYMRNLYNTMSGIVFLPEESVYNIVRTSTDVIRDNVKDVWRSTTGKDWTFWEPKIKAKLGDEYYESLINKLGEGDVIKGTTKLQGIVDSIRIQVTNEDKVAGEIVDIVSFEKNVFKEHLKWVDVEVSAGSDIGLEELGLLTGFFEQNTDTMPIELPERYLRKTVKRIVFMRASAFVTPTSWIYKGILATQMTAGCEGNSICLYSHGAETPESPYYLEKDADKFSIRVWRPVDPLLNYGRVITSVGASLATGVTVDKTGNRIFTATKTVGGAAALTAFQSALMWIPEHPRFYVVSPCFAIAKVWKTEYENKDTIFVKPDKIDMEGKASNYCYADQELVNRFMIIWLATDVLNVVEAVFSTGSSSMIKSVVSQADFANLIQIVTEAASCWPGYPYKDMTYDIMQSEVGSAAYNDLAQQLKEEGFDY